MNKRPQPGDTVEFEFITADGPIRTEAVVEEVHFDDGSYEHIIVNVGGRRKAVLDGDFRIKKSTTKPAVEHQPSPEKQTRG
jgi:hypothetical protein